MAAAEAQARTLLVAMPDDVEAWNLLGVVLRSDGRAREALPCYRAALARDPGHAGAWTNLGNAYRDLHHIESALACHRRALAIQPRSSLLHHNLGIALMAANRPQEASAAYSRAILLRPDAMQPRWDRALSYLVAGRWAEGWADYGARQSVAEFLKRTMPGQPWLGQNFAGATLLVACEQGFGDAIWCWRYLPLVRALGGKVVLECRRELVALARAQDFADAVIARGDPLPAAEFHVYQCSLPGLFTPDPSAIPPAPYLRPAPGRDAALAPLFAAAGNALRVGIAWSGSTTFKANAERSAPFSRFLDGFALPGVALFSLQMGRQRQDMQEIAMPAGAPLPAITDLAPHLQDFADTAAALQSLDLVIMTDSAVAHLGGALGRPVWVLLGSSPYWLWGEAEQTPWYPSLRLFRSPQQRGWDEVFDAAGLALMEMVAARSAG
jgi:hypothetical protein